MLSWLNQVALDLHVYLPNILNHLFGERFSKC